MGRDWRNNWDPTRFWRCDTLNGIARTVRCAEEVGQDWGWLEAAGTCVPWGSWRWTFPSETPSGLARRMQQ